MSSFKNIFRSTKNRKSIPKSWCGLWKDKNGKSDSLSKIIIKPDVGMGLYDDWEVDLGVSWAFPLEDFKKD